MNKEKHISYNTLLDELFKAWRSEMVKIEKGNFNFTADGLLYKNHQSIEQTESEWLHSSKKVLFLLKDQNQKSEVKWDEDIRYWLKDRESDRPQDLENKSKNRTLTNSFIKCLAYLLWGIIKADNENDWWYEEVEMHHDEVVELFNTLPFAFVECKKMPGGGSLDSAVLKQHLRNYGTFLKQEIEILNPNIIVCTSQQSYDFVLKMYPNDLVGLDGNMKFRYHPGKHLLIILSLHPSARRSNKGIYDDFMYHYRLFIHHQSVLIRSQKNIGNGNDR